MGNGYVQQDRPAWLRRLDVEREIARAPHTLYDVSFVIVGPKRRGLPGGHAPIRGRYRCGVCGDRTHTAKSPKCPGRRRRARP